MPRSLSENSVAYTHSLFKTRSYAGKCGSASRWKGHVKKPTTHIRVYQDDYNKLVSLVGKLPSVDSISSAFAYAVDRVFSRRCMACKKP